jgi:hypothetical protein
MSIYYCAESAKAAAEIQNNNGKKFLEGSRFCPLINSKCRSDCQCFKPAYVSSSVPSRRREYVVNKNYCDNPMLTGNRNIEVSHF